MTVYLDESTFPLANTPVPLRQKRFYEAAEAWLSTFGVRLINIDGNGVASVDISGATRAHVFDWLADVAAVCVDLEPQDVSVLAGRTPTTLFMADMIAEDPAVRASCQKLEVGEIMDTIEELAHLALTVSNRNREVGDALILEHEQLDSSFATVLRNEREKDDRAAIQRLRDAGFEVPDEVSLEPIAAPQVDYSQWEEPATRVSEIDPFAFNNN